MELSINLISLFPYQMRSLGYGCLTPYDIVSDSKNTINLTVILEVILVQPLEKDNKMVILVSAVCLILHLLTFLKAMIMEV